MLTDETRDEIIEIARNRAARNGLTPEQVIKQATYYADRATPSAASAVQWAIDSLNSVKKNVGFMR